MGVRKLYKLTDQRMRTYGGFQWTLGQWVQTNGDGDLCSPGWLHAYSSPELALFMNINHGDYKEPRLFKADGSGKYKDDKGLKCGVTRLNLTKELQVVKPTLEQYCKFSIYCALEVYNDPRFVAWANARLSGGDRTDADAYTAASAAGAAGYAYANPYANYTAANANANANAAAYANYADYYAADAANAAAYANAAKIDFAAIAKQAMA